MAKRKRLTMPETPAPVGDIKSLTPMRRAPIAEVAGEASAHAALDKVAAEIAAARKDGRMAERLPLDVIDTDFLLRDRMVLDREELEALKESIAERGQQTPIEVVDLKNGRYGLISGWRRVAALSELHAGLGTADFGKVLAFVRQPASLDDAYVAMVEENEIRSPLSYYERARVAMRAAERGVFPTPEIAVKRLYSRTKKSKRSKIRSFLTLCRTLDDALSFPAELGERIGLDVVRVIGRDPDALPRLRDALTAARPADAAEEQLVLRTAMSPARRPAPAQAPATDVVPGVALTSSGRQITLKGARVDTALRRALEAWLRDRFRD